MNSKDGFGEQKGMNSSLSSLFEELSNEIKKEQETNILFKFKKNLSESVYEIKQRNDIDGFNPFISYTTNSTSKSIYDEPQNLNEEIFIINDEIEDKDFVSSIVQSISKEESNRKIKENTDLFNQPNVKILDPNIKSIQNQLKHLEDWISKISMTGPGSGEVNFRWLDDVNRDTIGNTNQLLRYDPTDKKFFFGQLSGDQGPVNSIIFNTTGTANTPIPGTLSWNTEKDCLNVTQNDDSILQVGLENYIRVHNSTANTLTNGTLVMFAGVNGGGETPTCVPLNLTSTFIPLYTIGILTSDIPSGENGRATNLGEVRNLNTTGSDVGEIWSIGDLLWAKPNSPGKLTNIQPTAPYPVISVAAVIKVDSVDGIILVRPTIFPRLFYGSFYDTTTQYANTINTPYNVTYSNTQISSGFYLANNSQITAQHPGLYNYQFSMQVQSDVSAAHNVWVWYRKNGQDVPYSATQVTINKSFSVLSWNFIESMNIGEYFELMWAVDSPTVKIISPSPTSFCPATPGVILTVTQVNL